MKIQLAELRNKPIRDVVQTLVTMTPEEVDAIQEEIAVTKRLFKAPEPEHGVVVAFLKSELANPTSLFVTACSAVKLPPTKRQASKWMHKKGLAYTSGRFVNRGN